MSVVIEGPVLDQYYMSLDMTRASRDATVPTFAGVVSAVAMSRDTINLGWAAGNDETTAQINLVYEIHWAKSAAAPFAVRGVSAPGATAFSAVDLQAGTTYYFRVRTRDEAGNVSTDGGVELSATTAADLAPTFAGAAAAVAIAHDSVTVSWAAATDDATPQGSLVYEIHVAREAAASFVVAAVSAAGATSHTVEGLNANTRYWFRVRARDSVGNVSTDGGTEHDATTPDNLASHPTISNVTPAAGTAITPTTPVTFDVVDDSGTFRRVIVHVHFPATGAVEVVHDGDAFVGFYSGTSTRQAIAGGFRFSVLRAGGWRSAPTFKTFAIDTEGFEV